MTRPSPTVFNALLPHTLNERPAHQIYNKMSNGIPWRPVKYHTTPPNCANYYINSAQCKYKSMLHQSGMLAVFVSILQSFILYACGA